MLTEERVYYTVVQAVLLYGYETSSLKEEILNRPQVFNFRFLLSIVRVSSDNRVSIVEVKRWLSGEDNKKLLR